MRSQSFYYSAGIEPAPGPKDLLTMIALYHSSIDVLIEFDKYVNGRVVQGNRRKEVLWSRRGFDSRRLVKVLQS